MIATRDTLAEQGLLSFLRANRVGGNLSVEVISVDASVSGSGIEGSASPAFVVNIVEPALDETFNQTFATAAERAGILDVTDRVELESDGSSYRRVAFVATGPLQDRLCDMCVDSGMIVR